MSESLPSGVSRDVRISIIRGEQGCWGLCCKEGLSRSKVFGSVSVLYGQAELMESHSTQKPPELFVFAVECVFDLGPNPHAVLLFYFLVFYRFLNSL
jgi:hypothetical protein